MSDEDTGNEDDEGSSAIGRGNYLMGAASGEVYFYSQGDGLITLLRPLLVFALFYVFLLSILLSGGCNSEDVEKQA